MKVSFVIPVHNESALIGRCIDHLRRSKDFQAHQILVVLSAATDDNTEQALIEKSVEWVRCAATSRAIQMNLGARMASGDILCFLHADVCLPEDAIDLISNSINEGNQAGYFSYRFDKESFFLKINSRLTKKDGLFSGGGDQSLFIKKSVFEDMEGFDESCVIMEDFELFDRLKSTSIQYVILQQDAIVSARKYDHNSYLKVNLVNGLIFSMYKLGTPTPLLKKLYSRLLK